CENNLYATHSPLSVRLPAGTRIHRRAAAYGMASERVDGNDLVAVYRGARRAVERCRRDGGPVFLECMTYRWLEHVGPLDDRDRGYRSGAEIEAWKRRDPVKRSARALVAARIATLGQLAEIETQIQAELADAVAAARRAPWLDPKDLLLDVV